MTVLSPWLRSGPSPRTRQDLTGLPKGQIDALAAHHRVLAVGQRRDTVKEQPGRPAPYRDVAMLQPKPARLVGALQPAEQEDRRQAKRHRDDRRVEILLVPVL